MCDVLSHPSVRSELEDAGGEHAQLVHLRLTKDGDGGDLVLFVPPRVQAVLRPV
jgi:hypothetical protein